MKQHGERKSYFRGTPLSSQTICTWTQLFLVTVEEVFLLLLRDNSSIFVLNPILSHFQKDFTFPVGISPPIFLGSFPSASQHPPQQNKTLLTLHLYPTAAHFLIPFQRNCLHSLSLFLHPQCTHFTIVSIPATLPKLLLLKVTNDFPVVSAKGRYLVFISFSIWVAFVPLTTDSFLKYFLLLPSMILPS